MSPTLAVKGKESGTARVLGSGTSGMPHSPYQVTAHSLISHYPSPGVAELLIFHPVDTIAKRLMSNKAKVGPARALALLISS
jgi:hypothetical protein